MRKILHITRNGIAALSAVGRHTSFVAIGASLAVTFCCLASASAQTSASFPSLGVPSAAPPVQRADQPSGTSSWQQGTPTVDASYSIARDTTSTQPASFLGPPPPVGSANPCVAGCDVSWYFGYEALWLKREGDDRFSLSRNNFMPEFDYEFGGRYTAGRMLDCVNAWELVYTGPFEWERASTINAAGTLQSNFAPSGGFTAADITTFNNADTHSQRYRAELQSFELNRRWFSWDAVSTMVGIRYVDYEEDYAFFSSNGLGNGLYAEQLDNRLIGAQVGADIVYPVSLRTNVGIRGKAGAYANFAERETLLTNAGSVVLNAGDEDVDIAGIIEMGVFSTYQITPSIRLTSGYEFWYMPNLATVPEQRPALLTPSSGSSVTAEDDVFLHGGSLGVQVLF